MLYSSPEIRLINNLSEKGLSNKFPNGAVSSADSVGWLCKRLNELSESDKKLLIKKDLTIIFVMVSQVGLSSFGIIPPLPR